MGVMLVVILECDGQIAHGRHGIGLGHKGRVIAFHRLHEAFRHAVTLQAAGRRRQRLQVDAGSEGARLCNAASSA